MKIPSFAKILSATALVSLAGCYSYAPLAPPFTQDSYSAVNEADHRVLEVDGQMLTLKEAQKISLKNNPDYESMRHAVSAAWARYYQQMSAYFPTVTAGYDINHNNAMPKHQHRTALDRTSQVEQTLSLTTSWLVFDGLQRTMNMLAAKHSAKQSEAQEEDGRRVLVQAVATSYNDVLLAIEQIRIAKTDKEFQEKLLKDTEVKYDAGASPLSDVLNFRVKVNEAVSAEIDAKYNYATSKYALGELLGLSTGDVPETTQFPPIDDISESPLTGINVYLDTALSNRPDLKAFREALESAQYTLYARWGAFSPTATFNATLNQYQQKTSARHRHGANGRRYDVKSRTVNFNYGGSFEWVIFNGGERIANLREAQALVAESQADVANIWIQVVAEVRQAYDNYVRQSQQSKLLKKIYDLQKQQRDLVEEEYKAGNATLTRLNEAQRDLVQADTNMVSALINLQNAHAQLEAATNSNQIRLPKTDEE